MAFPLNTGRVSLAPVTEQDAAFMHRLMSSPGWLTYIGDKGLSTVEETRKYLLDIPIKTHRETGMGVFVIWQNRTPVGIISLVQRDYLDAPPPGFCLAT